MHECPIGDLSKGGVRSLSPPATGSFLPEYPAIRLGGRGLARGLREPQPLPLSRRLHPRRDGHVRRGAAAGPATRRGITAGTANGSSRCPTSNWPAHVLHVPLVAASFDAEFPYSTRTVTPLLNRDFVSPLNDRT